MRRNEWYSICAYFIDDSTIGENCLAANHHAVDHRHADSDRCIVDDLALDAKRLTLLLDNGRGARWHSLCSDHFNAQASFTDAFDDIKDYTWVAMNEDGLQQTWNLLGQNEDFFKINLGACIMNQCGCCILTIPSLRCGSENFLIKLLYCKLCSPNARPFKWIDDLISSMPCWLSTFCAILK